MDMNTNSVYQNIKWYLLLKYYTLRSMIPKKCTLCLKYHTDEIDVLDCYNIYLIQNPKNVYKEVWDIDNKIWVKN